MVKTTWFYNIHNKQVSVIFNFFYIWYSQLQILIHNIIYQLSLCIALFALLHYLTNRL